MSTALVSEVILDGLEMLKLLLFGSEILDSCHSSRLSWISKIQYQIEIAYLNQILHSDLLTKRGI